ncbi:MAG: hypothetical protein LBJ00_12245 [Planctomycetaceae bacterium]|jgi:chromosome segregation ATPase|nr:hypothetical protein [Planctomycetaceae bacterium]
MSKNRSLNTEFNFHTTELRPNTPSTPLPQQNQTDQTTLSSPVFTEQPIDSPRSKFLSHNSINNINDEPLHFAPHRQQNETLSSISNLTSDLQSRTFGSRGIDSTTARILARQEEIDHRENQLNARMAQFETLVRNTKISLQAKMEEVSQREQQLEELDEQLEYRHNSQEEWIRTERNKIENEHSDLATRKTEIDERLLRRERELHDIAEQREAEIVANAKIYREQLETKLHDCKADYQDRYEKKCREFETEFDKQVRLEKLEYDSLRESLERQFDARVSDVNRELEAVKQEYAAKFAVRQTELERNAELRQREIADGFEHRAAMLNEEYEHKNAELETKYERREEQLTHRELLVHQSEEDWNNRRELFEGQWNEFEQLRNGKINELDRREKQLEERNVILGDFESKLKRREVEVATLDESLKAREYQISLEAPRYANLQQREAELMELQSEVARIRESLVKERHQMQKATEAERRRLRESQELALRRIEDERQNLAQQNKRLEQMRLAIDRSREELGRMHRETLEIRLATEELWIRLADGSVSEDLKTSVTNIRSKLTEEYRASMVRIDTQKAELEESRNDIIKQYDALISQREQLEEWISTNEHTIKERELMLANRENELEKRQTRLDEIIAKTHQERVDMEKEIRLLQEQIELAFDTQKVA